MDKLPEPSSPAQVRGTLVHAVLERLFDFTASERTVDAARGLIAPQWDHLLADHPEFSELMSDAGGEEAWFTAVTRLVDSYFTLEDPTRLEPAEREKYVETQLASGVLLRGYIDRLDVAPNGWVRVVDYKTGKAPDPRWQEGALFQMKFYALVLWRLNGEIPKLLQLVYLGSGSILRYEPTEADLVATQRKVEVLWDAIQESARTGEWATKKSRLCDWCAHRALCPEFGGTPPDVPADRVEWLLGEASRD